MVFVFRLTIKKLLATLIKGRLKMNFKDVKVGQILTDVYKNEYIVLEFLNDGSLVQTKIKCVKIKNPICIDLCETIKNVGDVTWISNNYLIKLSPKINK